MEYSNSQKSIFKQLHAPNRVLTDGELQALRLRCDDGWSQLSPEDKAQWAIVHTSNVHRRRVERLAVAAKAPPSSSSFKPLWKTGTRDCHHCVSLADMVNEHGSTNFKDRRKCAWDDPTLRVQAPFEKRVSDSVGLQKGLIFGCHGEKKNVCRETLLEPTRAKFENMTGRLTGALRLTSQLLSFGLAPS